MTAQEISKYRIQNQLIFTSNSNIPEAVVRQMTTIQAQDYKGAKWSIGLRSKDFTDRQIEHSIAQKKIVRTWTQRGTLHFVHRDDLRWLLGLNSEKMIASCKSRYKELELDEEIFSKSNKIFENALIDYSEISRTDLLNLLDRKGINIKGQRAAYILQNASLRGIMCQVRTEKNVPNYIAINESFPLRQNFSREEAISEFAQRYFRTRNPSTEKDFAWWSGLSAADVRIAMESVKSKFEPEVIDGFEYWIYPGSEIPKISEVEAYVLPGFDEFLLSYSDRTASIAKEHSKLLNNGGGILFPTVIMGGRVVGMWQRKFVKDYIVINLTSFNIFSKLELEAIEIAFGKFGEFLEKEIKIIA